MKTIPLILIIGALLGGCRVSDNETDVILHKSEPFKVALTAFYMDVGRYPTDEEGLRVLIYRPENDGARWRGPYIEGPEIPRDPWGREVRYRFPAEKSADGYDIWSLGKDGIESSDDVGNWKK